MNADAAEALAHISQGDVPRSADVHGKGGHLVEHGKTASAGFAQILGEQVDKSTPKTESAEAGNAPPVSGAAPEALAQARPEDGPHALPHHVATQTAPRARHRSLPHSKTASVPAASKKTARARAHVQRVRSKVNAGSTARSAPPLQQEEQAAAPLAGHDEAGPHTARTALQNSGDGKASGSTVAPSQPSIEGSESEPETKRISSRQVGLPSTPDRAPANAHKMDPQDLPREDAPRHTPSPTPGTPTAAVPAKATRADAGRTRSPDGVREPRPVVMAQSTAPPAHAAMDPADTASAPSTETPQTSTSVQPAAGHNNPASSPPHRMPTVPTPVRILAEASRDIASPANLKDVAFSQATASSPAQPSSSLDGQTPSKSSVRTHRQPGTATNRTPHSDGVSAASPVEANETHPTSPSAAPPSASPVRRVVADRTRASATPQSDSMADESPPNAGGASHKFEGAPRESRPMARQSVEAAQESVAAPSPHRTHATTSPFTPNSSDPFNPVPRESHPTVPAPVVRANTPNNGHSGPHQLPPSNPVSSNATPASLSPKPPVPHATNTNAEPAHPPVLQDEKAVSDARPSHAVAHAAEANSPTREQMRPSPSSTNRVSPTQKATSPRAQTIPASTPQQSPSSEDPLTAESTNAPAVSRPVATPNGTTKVAPAKPVTDPMHTANETNNSQSPSGAGSTEARANHPDTSPPDTADMSADDSVKSSLPSPGLVSPKITNGDAAPSKTTTTKKRSPLADDEEPTKAAVPAPPPAKTSALPSSSSSASSGDMKQPTSAPSPESDPRGLSESATQSNNPRPMENQPATTKQDLHPTSFTPTDPPTVLAHQPMFAPQYTLAVGHEASTPPAILTERANLFDRAVDDPGLSLNVMPHAAHLSIASSAGDLALHVRVRDGSADVHVSGTMAPLFDTKAPEIRAALAGEGLSLGSYATDQQGSSRGQHGQPGNSPKTDDTHPLPVPLRTTTTTPEVQDADDRRIHVTA